jgi:hypothetical protein
MEEGRFPAGLGGPILLRDRLNKRNGLDPQCVRQFDDIDQTNVALTPFDSANVVSM